MAIVLDQNTYAHPQDPRILVTSILENFEAVASDDQYAGAILQRDPAHKKRLEKMFQKIAQNFDIAAKRFHVFDLVFQGEDILITQHGSDHMRMQPSDDILNGGQALFSDEMAQELSAVAKSFNRMLGCGEIDLKLWRNPEFPFHPHVYHVLNFVPGCAGTIWKNEQQEILGVDQGDLFYFKPGIEHASAKRDGVSNDLIVVMS